MIRWLLPLLIVLIPRIVTAADTAPATVITPSNPANLPAAVSPGLHVPERMAEEDPDLPQFLYDCLGPPPPPRYADGRWTDPFAPRLDQPSVVLDEVRHRLIAFGGTASSWYEFSIESGQWHPMAIAGEPLPARSGYSLIMDPRGDRLIVIGGGPGSGISNEVWEVALTGEPRISRLTPAGTPPAPRRYQCAVLDSRRNRILVFGGELAEVCDLYVCREYGCWCESWLRPYSNEVWELTLDEPARWNRVQALGSPPTGRGFSVMAYDTIRDRLIVIGGGNSAWPPFRDAWTLSLSGVPVWQQLPQLPQGMSATHTMAGTYDPVGDRLLVIHGSRDVWTLELTGTPQWSRVIPANTGPSARNSNSMTRDPVSGEFLSLGAETRNVWAFDAGTATWRTVEQVRNPAPPTWGHAMVWDATRGRALSLGGESGGTIHAQLWSWSDENGGSWGQLAASNTPPQGGRTYHSVILDGAGDRLVTFGGIARESGVERMVSDSWALSLTAPHRWSRLSGPGSAPQARAAHSAVHDARDRRVIVFGGNARGTLMNDVWSFDLASSVWAQLQVAGEAPQARAYHAAAFDSLTRRMLVFGGSNGFGQPLNDVWMLELVPTPRWTRLPVAGEAPLGRYSTSVILDPTDSSLLVFGGSSKKPSGQCWLNDVWRLELGPVPAWSRLAPHGATPSVRRGHQAVFDPRERRMIVFGGGIDTPTQETHALGLDDFLQTVTVDVRPGTDQNVIRAGASGHLPVAILGNAVVGAADLDPATLLFSSSGPTHRGGGGEPVWYRDVNHDGRTDAVFHIELDSLSLEPSDDELEVRGLTREGIPFQGKDRVRVVPGKFDPDEIRARVVSAVALRLEISSPLVNALTARLSVPGGEETSIALYDVRGRRVAGRTMHLGPGTHDVEVARRDQVAAGVYWVRLMHGREFITKRVIVLQ